MLPPNTVPITAEELDYISQQPEMIVVCVVDENDEQWNFFSKAQSLMTAQCKFYINAHDYRHYFGEVVDLAKYEIFVRQVVWRVEFLNNEFELHKYSWECRVYDYSQDENYALISGTEAECKQFIADHFTAIVAKDLPNYNLKFIFS
jgi:nicotinamide mononucleotide adenylyltransferase